MNFTSEGEQGGWGMNNLRERLFSIRPIVGISGAALWLGLMAIKTGADGIVALRNVLFFLVPLYLLCSVTRTVSLRRLATFFFSGGFMMGVALLGANIFKIFEPDLTAASRQFAIPFMEEALKLAPLLFFLWRWRKSTTWTISATDVLLMAAACGAGFGLVEEAYSRHLSGWSAELNWLPLTEIAGGRLISGNAIWTALAGLTIGLGLLFRDRGGIALAVTSSGFLWVTLDHAANNYAVGRHNGLVKVLNTVTANGYLTISFFIAGLLVALAADFYIAYFTLPRFREFSLPKEGKGLKASWLFFMDKRALAFAYHRYKRASGPELVYPAKMSLFLGRALANRHTEPAGIAPSVQEGQ